MSPEPDAPVALPFGAAYDRLQEVATELGADATMAPGRLIALLREGKGLERALRDHLERVEQEVRAIEDGAGAVPFRIVDAAEGLAGDRGRQAPTVGATVPGPAAPDLGAPEPAIPTAPRPVDPQQPTPERWAADPEPPAPPAQPQPPAPPTLGFAADDDIPF